jgi:tRNA-splicing ligase RtcB (3'-phosphate/5'-hydroxy nucleic acid ligase)
MVAAATDCLLRLMMSNVMITPCPSPGGVAEEAPGADKDVSAVAEGADHAKLVHKVARLEQLICIKG